MGGRSYHLNQRRCTRNLHVQRRRGTPHPFIDMHDAHQYRRRMKRGARTMCALGSLALAGALAAIVQAQEDKSAAEAPVDFGVFQAKAPAVASTHTFTQSIQIKVAKDTPLQIALDKEVRLRKAGQALHGRIVEPVYAFDKLVIPVGTEVNGRVTQIDPVPAKKRTAAALDANFTPNHKFQVTFDELILPDGNHITFQANITPGSGQVLDFVSGAEEHTKNGAKDLAAQKAKEAKQAAKQEWNTAMQQVKEPGKIRRFERYAIAQLPVHPQYVDAGTVYFAELQEPLDFGSEPITAELASSLGAAPPPGSFVHARLLTPLGSSSSHNGDEVIAIITQPLFDGKRLLYPQGTRLKGSVLQVKPAASLSRSGQLRVAFHDMVLEDGVDEKVQASLESLQADRGQNVTLDAEGGAQAVPPKTRFLTTTIAVGLGAASFLGDTFGDTGPRASGGAGGYKLIGIAIGLAVHSQSLGMAMGSFGAVRSIYVNFVARGPELTFPKNTPMQIGIAPPRSGPGEKAQGTEAPKL
jgi:type IV secretory pathway VirB10-like protein